MAFWCERCLPFEENGEDGVEYIASGHEKLKVYLGLCVEKCLVEEMYNGAGSGGMWG